MIIGVLSDTHSTIHPTVPTLFREAGVTLILHAGDVGKAGVLDALREIAPVNAVRGNNDTSGPTALLPDEFRLEAEGVSIYMTHIGGKPAAWLPKLPLPRPSVAICGHSHVALLQELGGVLFLNPGAAMARARFHKPLNAAILTVENGKATAEILQLI